MKEILQQEKEQESHKVADAFILFIMSHGSQGMVYGTDGEPLSIDDDIISVFDSCNCPALKNKPKIIFIQACQGSGYKSLQTYIKHYAVLFQQNEAILQAVTVKCIFVSEQSLCKNKSLTRADCTRDLFPN